MSISKDVHHTDEPVQETGTYICAAGKREELSEGEQFPVCPNTNKPTTWRHEDHIHHTGDQVTEAGMYVDEDNDELELAPGDTFPSCPESGQSTAWKHA